MNKRWIKRGLIAITLCLAGYLLFQAYLDRTDPARLADQEKWERLLEISIDTTKSRKRRLAALDEMINVFKPVELSPAMEADLVAFRDSDNANTNRDFEAFSERIAAILTISNNDLAAQMRLDLLNEAQAVVEQSAGSGGMPEFPPKNKRKTVGFVFSFRSEVGRPPFEISDQSGRAYNAPLENPFSNKSSSEIRQLKSRMSNIGVVVWYDIVVGEFRGVDFKCEGVARQRILELYLVDVHLKKVAAFKKLQGPDPIPYISIPTTSKDENCSGYVGKTPEPRQFFPLMIGH